MPSIRTTSDEQLLRGSLISLPLIQVTLPFIGVYVVVPLLLLAFTQLRFLPHQSKGATTLHRLLVVLDFAVVVYFFAKTFLARDAASDLLAAPGTRSTSVRTSRLMYEPYKNTRTRWSMPPSSLYRRDRRAARYAKLPDARIGSRHVGAPM